jgi:glycosyltransferase involved in cell wall biosynthesis
LKILITVDPEIPVPPAGYGGIERIVEMMIGQYEKKGHEVILCAHPHSNVSCRLVGWRGARSQQKTDIIKNTIQLSKLVYGEHFDILHSFSRLAYMTAVFPLAIPKLMTYQREPSLKQVKKATLLARRGTLQFTGCSDYISLQISRIAKASTIYNCAPINRYTLTEGLPDDAPLIFLGRIEPVKGTATAVQVAQLTMRRLIIAGNIPAEYQWYFDQKIKPYLSERIQYIGPVNDAEKNFWLGKSLALLMPITWNEPFGIVMAEAMACGTPVLGFAKGAVPEVIEHGVNGFLSENLGEMANHVNLCKALNRTAIRTIAMEKFGDEKISEDYLGLYCKMVNKL